MSRCGPPIELLCTETFDQLDDPVRHAIEIGPASAGEILATIFPATRARSWSCSSRHAA